MPRLRIKAASNRLRRNIQTGRTRRSSKDVSYSIYVADTERDGIKSPVFGKITQYAIDKLGLKLSDLQKIPNGGKYKSLAGLSLDYDFNDNILWERMSGKAGAVDYNSYSPLPANSLTSKMEIFLEGTERAVGAVDGSAAKKQVKVTIGLPDTTRFSEVALFAIALKLDKNSKVLRYKWGKLSETLREFSGAKKKAGTGSGARKSSSSQGEWHIPVGYANSTRLTKEGVPSKGVADTKKTLVIATMKESAAERLGLSSSGTTKEGDIKGGTEIGKSIDSGGASGKAKIFQVFTKFKAYSIIFDKDEIAYNPGNSVTVKCLFTQFSNKANTQSISSRRVTSSRTQKASESVQFALPSTATIGMIYEILRNMPKPPSSFAVNRGGKSFGSSYQIASKSAKLK